MAGYRDDQPNIPVEYKPDTADKEEYESGQFEGVLTTQDSEE